MPGEYSSVSLVSVGRGVNEDIAGKLAASLPGGMSPGTLRALAARARERHLQPGETLLRQGDAAEQVYVVVAGRLCALFHDSAGSSHAFATLEAGALLGEIAVLTGGRREATVIADTAATVMELVAADFERLLESDPDIARRLAEQATQRLRQAQLAHQLTILFPEVSEPARGALLAGVDWVPLRAGEHLVRRGDTADSAYIVVAGRLRVTDDQRAPLGGSEVGPGELVGEMALVEGGIRTATLVAVRDTHVARIERAGFLDALRDHPEALLRIARVALQRSMHTARKPGEQRRTIALVALHSGVNLPGFADSLVREMGRVDAAGLRTRAQAHEAVGARCLDRGNPDSPGFARLTQWLQEQEARHETLLLQATGEWTSWNDLVLRQADHAVLIADAGADPELTATEARMREALGARGRGQNASRLRQSLVLLHADAGTAEREAPRRSARWLAPRDVDACYHLRRGHAGDLSRLSRILAERPISLVLSGGGARGFAHLGVVRALQEAGVPVDMVAGTSMGAVIATLVALDLDPWEQAVRAKSVLTPSLLDWTLPLAGLVKAGRMTERADRITGGRDIEDLWLPWFIVSTNLTRSESVAHRRGSITRALRASVAIPGVIPPVAYGDELHVDGGVLDNLPVEPMRRINPRGLVIAVDVALNEGPRVPEDFGLSVSGWQLLARRLASGRRGPYVPGVGGTLVQSMIAGSSRARDRVIADGLADLYLDLHLPRCGMLDFGRPDPLIAAGYESAAPRVRAWAATLPAGMRRGGD